MITRLLRFAVPVILTICLLARPALSLTIIRNFRGGEQPPNAFGGNIVDLFNAAADLWELAILDHHTVRLHYEWAPITGSFATHQFLRGENGREVEGLIRFDNDNSAAHFPFWLDPTPYDIEEFENYIERLDDFGGGQMVAARYWRTSQDSSLPGADVLTIVIHEIGRALGLSLGHPNWQTESQDFDIDVLSPTPFAGTVIPLATNLYGVTSHVDYFSVMGTGGDGTSRFLPGGVDILANAQLSRFVELNMNLLPKLHVSAHNGKIHLSWSAHCHGYQVETAESLAGS